MIIIEVIIKVFLQKFDLRPILTWFSTFNSNQLIQVMLSAWNSWLLYWPVLVSFPQEEDIHILKQQNDNKSIFGIPATCFPLSREWEGDGRKQYLPFSFEGRCDFLQPYRNPLFQSRPYLPYPPNQDRHARKRVLCEFLVICLNCRYQYYCLRELPKLPLSCWRGQMENRQDLGGRDVSSSSPFPGVYWWTWCELIWYFRHKNFWGREWCQGLCSSYARRRHFGNLVALWYWILRKGFPFCQFCVLKKCPSPLAFLECCIYINLRFSLLFTVLKETVSPLLNVLIFEKFFNDEIAILFIELSLLQSKTTFVSGILEWLWNHFCFEFY